MPQYKFNHSVFEAQNDVRLSEVNDKCAEGWEVWQVQAFSIQLPDRHQIYTAYFLRKEVE